MAVADLVAESIDTEQLRAAVAADAFRAMLIPWSAGSGLQAVLTGQSYRGVAAVASSAADRWRWRDHLPPRVSIGVTIRTGAQ